MHFLSTTLIQDTIISCLGTKSLLIGHLTFTFTLLLSITLTSARLILKCKLVYIIHSLEKQLSIALRIKFKLQKITFQARYLFFLCLSLQYHLTLVFYLFTIFQLHESYFSQLKFPSSFLFHWLCICCYISLNTLSLIFAMTSSFSFLQSQLIYHFLSRPFLSFYWFPCYSLACSLSDSIITLVYLSPQLECKLYENKSHFCFVYHCILTLGLDPGTLQV